MLRSRVDGIKVLLQQIFGPTFFSLNKNVVFLEVFSYIFDHHAMPRSCQIFVIYRHIDAV